MENKETEEEIKLKKPKIDEKDLEIERLKSENIELRKQIEELENYILRQKKELQYPQQTQQDFINNPLIASVINAIISKFLEDKKTSEIDTLLYYQERAKQLKEAMRSPMEDEILRNSLEMQKAFLEMQRNNLLLQQHLTKHMLKQMGIQTEEKRRPINIKIPPEAFEHEE